MIAAGAKVVNERANTMSRCGDVAGPGQGDFGVAVNWLYFGCKTTVQFPVDAKVAGNRNRRNLAETSTDLSHPF